MILFSNYALPLKLEKNVLRLLELCSGNIEAIFVTLQDYVMLVAMFAMYEKQ